MFINKLNFRLILPGKVFTPFYPIIDQGHGNWPLVIEIPSSVIRSILGITRLIFGIQIPWLTEIVGHRHNLDK